MKRALLLGLGLVALSLMVGCGGGGDGGEGAAEGTYVGTVEGTGAYIALVSDGSQLVGYISDSERLSTWFDQAEIAEKPINPNPTATAALGKAMENVFAHHLLGTQDIAALTTREGETLGEAILSGSEAEGRVEVDGEERSFSAELASGEAGLYRAAKGKPREPGSVEAGWIVLADGSQRGNVSIVGPDGSSVGPAPKLDPAASTVSVPSAGTIKVAGVVEPAVLSR